MKKIIIISFLLFIFLVNPASADLFDDMNQRVVAYNQNVDKVPSLVNSLLGNEEIYGIIELNDGSALELKVVTKDATVVEFHKVGIKIEAEKGDCNGDGYLSAVDSLCALKMSTGKMEEDANVDVDDSGAVTSLDARIILQSVVGLSSEIDPTVVVISNEDTLRKPQHNADVNRNDSRSCPQNIAPYLALQYADTPNCQQWQPDHQISPSESVSCAEVCLIAPVLSFSDNYVL